MVDKLVDLFLLTLFECYKQLNSNQMKHLQQNSKLLEKYMVKVHQQLKMRIKFCKQRATQRDLVMMLLEYVDHQSNLLTNDANKENTCSNNIHNNPELLRKSQEIDYLKQQIKIEAELTKNFFKQLKKDSMQDSINIRTSYRESNRCQPFMSPSSMTCSINQVVPMTHAFEPFAENNENVLTSPKTLKESIETKAARESGRTSRITTSYNEVKESRMIQNQREKSKTFAKLRKVQALFCRGQKKAALSRNRSLASQSWMLSSQQDSKAMVEENQNLKAIQSNLVTHLSIMQRYKNVPSVEELVHKEEKLRKKEMELKDLERTLEKREKFMNNSQMEVLKRQKSIKML